MKRNIYIVHGPFQLFNCCEARHRFHDEEHNILIFIDRGDNRNREQTLRILKKDRFDQFHHIAFESIFDKYLYPFRLRGLLQNLMRPDTLYVSLYRNISSHIINTLSPNKVIIYDDGNRLLTATRRIFRENQPRKFKTFARWSKLLSRKLDLDFTRTATYFSFYQLPLVPEENYLKNDYSHYMRTVGSLPINDYVDFLGSKVIGHGISQKTFEKLITQVVAYYRKKGKSLRYITHRNEPLEYLEKLATKLDFKLVNLPNIIEICYAQASSLPTEIATFRTAAVTNLHFIFKLPARIFEIPKNCLKSDSRDILEEIYRNFKEQGLPVEQLVENGADAN